MKALQFIDRGKIRQLDLAEPAQPGPGEALVQTHRMGICGIGISAYLGKMPFFEFPRIPGHELGLEVLEVGPDVSEVKVGDRCALEPCLNNPSSHASQRGFPNCCPDLKVLGVHTDGGLRERWICPARKLHPGDLSYDQLALVEPLAIGHHAVQRAAPEKGDSVLVIGAGPIGLACLEFLKLQGFDPIVMDLNCSRLRYCSVHLGLGRTIAAESKAEAMKQLQEFTGGRLANVVIDATGSTASMSGCFEFAALSGRIVYVGVTAGELRFSHQLEAGIQLVDFQPQLPIIVDHIAKPPINRSQICPTRQHCMHTWIQYWNFLALIAPPASTS